MAEMFHVGGQPYSLAEIEDFVDVAPDGVIEKEFHARGLECDCDEDWPEIPEEPDVDTDLLIDGLACIKAGKIEDGIRLIELAVGKANAHRSDVEVINVRRITP